MATYDLWIEAGRRFCPEAGSLGPGGVGVIDGRIAGWKPGSADETLCFPDSLLMPGLVDFHTHPDFGGRLRASRFGVDPDRWMLPRGVVTILSQGDVGADDWPAYRAAVVETARTRVRVALNISRTGESSAEGSCADPGDLDVHACVRTILEEANRPDCAIWGIAVNTSRASCGPVDPRVAMDRALTAAELARVPLLVGTRRDADWPLEEQLPLLRRGDVVTSCFHGRPEGLLDSAGRVRECVIQARQRGVLFDLGHGASSFSFVVAEGALRQGFLPDTVSTDFYSAHATSAPEHSLLEVMARLIAVGAEFETVARLASLRPSQVLGTAGLTGCLTPGLCADLAVLGFDEHESDFSDAYGCVRRTHRIHCPAVFRAGIRVR